MVGLETLKLIVNQPFGVTGTAGKFDIVANVTGGGISGQLILIGNNLCFYLTVNIAYDILYTYKLNDIFISN